MGRTSFGCLPTAIGSMPQSDPVAACNEITRFLQDIPAWPQLPHRSFLEGQYAQFAEGFPGLDVSQNHFVVERTAAFDRQLENLYLAYEAKDYTCFATSPDHAAGLHALVGMRNHPFQFVKGQITGPITWGLGVTDMDRRPILYDEVLSDAIARFLHLKAAWQEHLLTKISRNTIVFVDEPSLSYVGSAFVSISPDLVVSLLNEVFSGISRLRGVHCCSNTDWPLLFKTNTDIVSFDAYGYAREFVLYPEEIRTFLARGGAIAWGIVPNNEAALALETVPSLLERLEAAISPLLDRGIPKGQLLEQALLTPSCSLAGLSVEGAGRALALLSDLSKKVRTKYSLETCA